MSVRSYVVDVDRRWWTNESRSQGQRSDEANCSHRTSLYSLSFTRTIVCKHIPLLMYVCLQFDSLLRASTSSVAVCNASYHLYSAAVGSTRVVLLTDRYDVSRVGRVESSRMQRMDSLGAGTRDTYMYWCSHMPDGSYILRHLLQRKTHNESSQLTGMLARETLLIACYGCLHCSQSQLAASLMITRATAG